MNSGIFGKDSRIDDKAKRDAVPGVMSQRAPVTPVPAPAASPAPAVTPTTAATQPQIAAGKQQRRRQ